MPFLHHIALRTRDLDRCSLHYRTLFGLVETARHGQRSVWLQAGEVVLMIERAETQEPLPSPDSLDLLAFATDDLRAAEARLAAHGLPIEARSDYTLYFRDPDGRRNALSCYRFDAP